MLPSRLGWGGERCSVSSYKLKQWVVSPEGNPEFATVRKVVRALGLRLHATTKHA